MHDGLVSLHRDVEANARKNGAVTLTTKRKANYAHP